MRIAMVAPLIEAVPPRLYGGTERVVSALTEELVRRGHAVTLFASADSHTRAELVPCAPRSLRLESSVRDRVAYTMAQLGQVYERAQDFDLIHSHVDYYAFPFARLSSTPTLSTAHGRLDLDQVVQWYAQFPAEPLVSISDAQRDRLARANWVATVYNGIDLDHFHFQPRPGDYLVFLGRMSPEKRPDRAIAIGPRHGHAARDGGDGYGNAGHCQSRGLGTRGGGRWGNGVHLHVADRDGGGSGADRRAGSSCL